MRKTVLLDRWTLAVVPDAAVRAGFVPRCREDLAQCPGPVIPGSVPGNFELDLMKAGLLEDLYYGDNIFKAQTLEDRHLWYFSDFRLEETPGEAFLVFAGIDTVAEIFVDGELWGETDNMFLPYEYSLASLTPGEHRVTVHILPAALFSRRNPAPLGCRALPCNRDSLTLRKAPYMYGWDIMPRTVSAGLWKPVTVEYRPSNRLAEIYLYTAALQGDAARISVTLRVEGECLIPGELTCRAEGVCGDSSFSAEAKIYGSSCRFSALLPQAKLWMPKNYGEPNLYDVTLSLYYRGTLCDRQTVPFGVRTVELDRTSRAGEDGEFCFKVNGQKIFCMGSNWVPPDAFPSRHGEYQRRGLEMLADLNCNIVRCWGGNVYPDGEFYDFCDRNGILVWQDFSMACAEYPNGEDFLRNMEAEAVSVIRALRNHPSLLLWSGDNECDEAGPTVRLNGRTVHAYDPNENRITRGRLPRVVRQHDPARPFLPSSPYLDPEACPDHNPSEDHLWGPRDFFKGKYYGTANCHFASETGYHGCPSPASLARFIPEERRNNRGDGKRCSDPVWLAHSACMETDPSFVYAYRVPLMTRQVERIFGTASPDLSEYALQSQISQAEAKKYFIERFRLGKWRRTGIIWWNLIDGWPQISDAVVDWYGCKKLAYHYIKTSQTPFCMAVDEPVDGRLTLCALNDTRSPVTVRYTVTDLSDGTSVLEGECTAAPDTVLPVASFPEKPGTCYALRWDGDAFGRNHFVAAIGEGIDLATYTQWLKALDYWDLREGF